jgi:hypothetical protein
MGCALILTGCIGDDIDVATGDGVGIDLTTQGLGASGTLTAADGTYTGCTGRLNTDVWSVRINEVEGTLANAPLTVKLGNAACQLNVTGLYTTTAPTVVIPANVGGIGPLTTSYATARSFGTPAVKFYANAKLNVGGFNADFTINVLYSDDPALVDGGTVIVTGNQAGVSDTVLAPSPNYDSLSLDGLIVAHTGNQVTGVTGTAILTAPGSNVVLGQAYVVTATVLPVTPVYNDFDTAFLAGTPNTLTESTIDGTAIAPTLNSVNLTTTPTVRTIIIANTVAGVRSYQAFTVGFRI